MKYLPQNTVCSMPTAPSDENTFYILATQNYDIETLELCSKQPSWTKYLSNYPKMAAKSLSSEGSAYYDDGYSTDTLNDDLDKLVAKFDRSIEALWSPNEPSPVSDELTQPQKPSFLQCGTNIMSSIWSTQSIWNQEVMADNTSYDQKWSDFYDDLQFGGVESELKESLTKLNHQKESVFQEVKPTTTELTKYPKTEITPVRVEPVEEDLLTSRRTHFCPIKFEENPRNLPDGSTFDIRASPDKVRYKRTESGSMFLDEDWEWEDGGDEVVEYMEFKGKCPSISESGSDDEWLGDEKSKFVLKFRVRQNEKYCQTDDFVTSESPQEVPAKRRLCSDFDIPDTDPLPLPCDCDDIWPTEFSTFSKIWSSDIWEQGRGCDSCGGGGGGSGLVGGGGSGEEELKELRQELQFEGEQLLSDISLYCFEIGKDVVNSTVCGGGTERKRRHSASLRAWHPQHLKALRSFTF